MFLLLVFISCVTTDNFLKFDNYYRQREEEELNLNQTFFPRLKNYYYNAKIASEEDYPWISRVIHSRRSFEPFMCNAICIDEKIFITAARCVYVLKITYTSLIYQGQRFTVKAFVMPSKESKQMFDDIGFIIVNEDVKDKWHTIETYNEKRPDKTFKWFANLKFDKYEHKVIGYALRKGLETEFAWKNEYHLTEMAVIIDMKICREILSYNNLIKGFNVPCYYSCTFDEYMEEENKCNYYHGVLGGAVVHMKSNKLFGVTTWGAYYPTLELPVGFAVPNSDSYFQDFACALVVRNKNSPSDGKNPCENSRKYIY